MSLKAILDSHGRNAVPFIDPKNPDRPVTLQIYRPEGHTPDWPVVVVLHGMLRNGDDYRDFWIKPAERHKLLIVAPTFSDEAYPEPGNYNNGRVYDDEGNLRPRDRWVYATPARVVEALREAGVMTQPKARIYGHSAGGQFVHRMVSTHGADCFSDIVAANAGWYSLPVLDRVFPEGLGGIGLNEDDLRRLFAYPLRLLAGMDDSQANAENLPSNPEALAQGPGRFQRACNYFARGKAAAERLDTPFNWMFTEVPGIAHDGCAMGLAAAAMWFDGALPQTSELTGGAEAVNF